MQEKYDYYIVESSFIARYDREIKKAERLSPENQWAPYSDLWDIFTNGRFLDGGEQRAMELQQLLLNTHCNPADKTSTPIPNSPTDSLK